VRQATRETLRSAAVVIAAVVAVGCGGTGSGNNETPTEVTGTIEQLTVSGPTARFSLRADGQTYVIHMVRDIDYGFDPRHLIRHRELGLPVRCTLERRGDDLVALEILDVQPS